MSELLHVRKRNVEWNYSFLLQLLQLLHVEHRSPLIIPRVQYRHGTVRPNPL